MTEYLVAPVTPDVTAALNLMGQVEQELISIPDANVVGRIGDRILLVQASPAAVARLRDVFGAQIRVEENQDLRF